MLKAAWGVVVLALLIGVYYLIPNIYHVLAARPLEPQYRHAWVFFAVGLLVAIALVAARFVRRGATERA
jgi:hypothetical protein